MERVIVIALHLSSVSVAETKGNWVTRRLPFSPNRKMHWAIRRKWNQAWTEAVGWGWKRARGESHFRFPISLPFPHPRITIYLRAVAPMDKDNAYASVKGIVDALKSSPGIGVIVDDDKKHLTLKVTPVKVHHRSEEGVTILIDPCSK